jgi:hypothetical protein
MAPAIVLLLASFALSCHRLPPKTITLTAPTDLQLGEAKYSSGDFGTAASFYEAYLSSNAVKDRDLALYHLGLAYALQGATPENLEKSQSTLKRLVHEYSETVYYSEATLLLSLQTEIKKLSDEATQKQAELNGVISKQQSEIDKLTNDIKEPQARIKALTEADLNRVISRQQSEIDKFKNEIKEQQAKINTLTEELQRLREIDMERRPSRPSR